MKTGLCLGGGGAKGFAHLGVYEVLRERKIPIDCIAGCSIGAIVGAGIAMGKTPEELKIMMQAFSTKVPHLFMPRRTGFMKGGVLGAVEEERALEEAFPKDLTFEDLPIPLAVNAVDLISGEEVIFSSGPLFPAIRASMSLPGLYPPVPHQGRLLIDGGVVNKDPVSLCRKLGATRVIAVDLRSLQFEADFSKLKRSAEGEWVWPRLDWPYQILMRSLSIAETARTDLLFRQDPPEILIQPELKDFTIFDVRENEAMIQKGREAAETTLNSVKF